MFTFVSIVYALVCLFLILVVLLQAGRGGGMGGVFGGAGTTVFGGGGATNILQKITWGCAALFMVLSMTLAYMSSSSDKALERASQRMEERERARDVGGTKAAKTKAGEMSVEGAAPAPSGEAAPAEEAPAEAPEAAPTEAPAPAAPAGNE